MGDTFFLDGDVRGDVTVAGIYEHYTGHFIYCLLYTSFIMQLLGAHLVFLRALQIVPEAVLVGLQLEALELLAGLLLSLIHI